MRRSTFTAVVVAGLLSQLICGISGQSGSCPVTSPNHDRPPDSVLLKAAQPSLQATTPIHGNGVIWTHLWPEGTVVFRKGGPGYVLADGSLKMKFLWLMATDGPLTVEGRRLDGTAGPLSAEIFNGFVGRGFQPSYLIFPTAGCWEVTAKANGSALSLVTMVTTSGF